MLRKCLLILLASLFLFTSCGVPNYFSYSSTDFLFDSISSIYRTAEVYVDDDIVYGVKSGTYDPIINTPKLYLMYAVFGSDTSLSSTLQSRMNSKFKGKVINMPSDFDSFNSIYGTYKIDDESFYCYAYPFRRVTLSDTGYTVKSGTYTGTIDFDYFYYTGDTAYLSFEMVKDPSSSSGNLLQLTISDGDSLSEVVTLCRFNRESFTDNINNYNDDDDDEFGEDDPISSMIDPTLHIYAAVSFGFNSYTNKPYIAAKELASFSFSDTWIKEDTSEEEVE